jgi:predicted MPP superfamily phosphohydrolase
MAKVLEGRIKRRFRRARAARPSLLTTLSLNAPVPQTPPPAYTPDPEITQTDIWLERLPAAYDGLRIVHLTDIHHSLFTSIREVQRAVHLANLLHPDLVALTGDYVTLSPSYIWPVAQALGKLQARFGTFAVLGNHDFQVDPNAVARALEAQDIRVLRNRHFALQSGDSKLWIAGVDDLWWGGDDLSEALKHVPAKETKILLCHNPLGIWSASRMGVDFVLSGHTHGGQVRLPMMNSFYRSKPGRRFVEGWNKLGSTQIYVNRGIGKVLVPMRVKCPPEIASLRLRRGMAMPAAHHTGTAKYKAP